MTKITPSVLSRARGCLLGQFAGDSLGSLVEFKSADEIREMYRGGVRELANGGTFGTIAGQPTDDSEMALALARALVKHGTYNQNKARAVYVAWLDSGPFDSGCTTRKGLRGTSNPESQANGALMRISPLGIFGTFQDLEKVALWARLDSIITHPHEICLQANALFAMAIAHAIRTGCSARDLYTQIVDWARHMVIDSTLMDAIDGASSAPPPEYQDQQGWVLIAFRNALYQLLHAPDLEEGVVDTVMRGGDTDTNAAICGSLLGAVYGRKSVPTQWVNSLLNCRPEEGREGVRNPRPECYWPIDALELAEQLLIAGLKRAL